MSSKYTEENRGNVSYSYTDVLTRTVEVDVFNGESYSPLFVPSDTIKEKSYSVIKYFIIKFLEIGIFFSNKINIH